MISQLLDFILHINDHLSAMVNEYGTFVYVILFLIIFVETGLVVMPFLPGDSLLFAVGALCANEINHLNIFYVMGLLILAAVAGDNCNYTIGRYLGEHVTGWTFRNKPLVKRDYIEKTEEFFEKYGTKAIIMARFVPIVRTIAPFVAGAGNMPYRRYITVCILGALLWVIGISMLGYTCGGFEIVKKNFELVVFGI
ncbi:MAG: VTT domain-containing protein, partial [Bacteroidota bacterium]